MNHLVNVHMILSWVTAF